MEELKEFLNSDEFAALKTRVEEIRGKKWDSTQVSIPVTVSLLDFMIGQLESYLRALEYSRDAAWE